MATSYKPPGRLGDPNMSLATDPRVDARLLPLLTSLGMGQNAPSTDLSPTAPHSELEKLLSQAEAQMMQLVPMLPCDLPSDADRPKVERKDISIKGVDGNDIMLHVFRETGTEGKTLPCVVYIHGGGM